ALLLLASGVSASPAAAISTPSTLSAPSPHGSLPKPDIRIVPGSTINLVSHDSRIPIAIRNYYDTEVKVLVRVKPTNFGVTIPGAVLISVPAQTTVHAEVPVQAITNGPVTLHAWLTTTSGIRLGKQVSLKMNVNADVETAILIAFAGLLVILVAIGLPRTLRKRRQKAEEAA
ncbi:MAG: hypothetical protein RLZZ626_916, partial [Actinomycetota bacterium]